MLVYWVPGQIHLCLYYRYVRRSLFEGNKKDGRAFFGCGRSLNHSSSTVALASADNDSIIGFTWVSGEKSE